jgi:hypothetical protein
MSSSEQCRRGVGVSRQVYKGVRSGCGGSGAERFTSATTQRRICSHFWAMRRDRQGRETPDTSCDQLARLRLDADMRAGLELHRRGALEGVKQKTAEGAGARINALTRRWGTEGRVRLCDALALADRTRTRGIRTLVSVQLRLQMLTSTGSHG